MDQRLLRAGDGHKEWLAIRMILSLDGWKCFKIGDNSSMHWQAFQLLGHSTCHLQLKGGEAYFGSWFQMSVVCWLQGRNIVVKGSEGENCSSHGSQEAESREGNKARDWIESPRSCSHDLLPPRRPWLPVGHFAMNLWMGYFPMTLVLSWSSHLSTSLSIQSSW